jgi:hypothetical protein
MPAATTIAVQDKRTARRSADVLVMIASPFRSLTIIGLSIEIVLPA